MWGRAEPEGRPPTRLVISPLSAQLSVKSMEPLTTPNKRRPAESQGGLTDALQAPGPRNGAGPVSVRASVTLSEPQSPRFVKLTSSFSTFMIAVKGNVRPECRPLPGPGSSLREGSPHRCQCKHVLIRLEEETWDAWVAQ